jgi:hypothetical protein
MSKGARRGGALLTSADPVNDLAGAIAVSDDAAERLSDLLQIWPSGAEPA